MSLSECHYTECHYAECHYAECPGATERDPGIAYCVSLPVPMKKSLMTLKPPKQRWASRF